MPHDFGVLIQELGEPDIYLLDQVMRGRITASDTVVDAGCGYGRNAEFLLRLGCRVFGVDRDREAIDAVRGLAEGLGSSQPAGDFRAEPIEAMTVSPGACDVVVCSAVLHFASDDAQFDAMLDAMWRALRPGGLFFCRLATTIGIEAAGGATRLRAGERIYRLGDGSTRYLADETQIISAMARLGGQLADPLKTTIVQGQRCMTTWVLRRQV